MFRLFIPSHIRAIAPYVPGKPMAELEREYGISDSIKLASNENPIGPSPLAVDAIRGALGTLNRYPDGAARDLTAALASHMGVPPEAVILGNGSDEIIGMLCQVLLQPGDEALIPQPSFLMYAISVCSAGASPVFVPLRDLAIDLPAILSRVTPETRIVFICNPNNPTGSIISRTDFGEFLSALPDTVAVVVDEAYAEFVRDPEAAQATAFIEHHTNVAVLRTFSKAYGLAGLRIGYGVMAPELAGMLHRTRPPFNASIPAQAGALAALSDKEFLEQTVRVVHEGLDGLYAALDERGLGYVPSQANFFLIDVDRDADTVFDALLHHGVIVRSMRSYGFPHFIRVNAGLADENRRFLKALDAVLAE